MWLIFGSELKTERVPNGARVEQHCQRCGETTMFYERVAATKLSLYFIELMEYGKRRVMACGACGALYATDELGAPEQSTTDKVIAAAGDAGTQFAKAAESAFGKLTAAAKGGIAELTGKSGRTEQEAPVRKKEQDFEDPLTSDEEATEQKFRDLEKKYRIGE